MKVINIPRRFVSSEWGGTETVIIETARQLKKLGVDSNIYTSKALSKIDSESLYEIPVKRFGYSYTRLGLSKVNKTLLDKRGGDPYSFSLFLDLLKCKADLFHLHTLGRIGALVRLVSKIRRIPYVVTIHGGIEDIPKEQMEKLLVPIKATLNWGKPLDILLAKHKVLSDAASVICVSDKERELLDKSHSKLKIIYLPNGINQERFEKEIAVDVKGTLQLDTACKVVLSVGGYYPQKNQLTLLKAFNTFLADHPDYKLIFAGVIYDQSYYDTLIHYVMDNELESSIKFLTNLTYEDPLLVALYQQCDIFVLPSYYETFGIVALEAWACSLPVICGEVGGLKSFIKNRVNGLFFDTNSYVDLHAKMSEIANSNELAQKLVRNANIDINKHKWRDITIRLLDLYLEIMNENCLDPRR